MSDDDYRQGFLDVFTKAVDSRLRAPSGIGRGNVERRAWIPDRLSRSAKEILSARGKGPLPTISAARRRSTDDSVDDPGDFDCPESQAILRRVVHVINFPNILIHPDQIDQAYKTIDDRL